MYAKSYKTLIKEMEGDSKKWKDNSGSWIRNIDIIKMTVLLEAITSLMLSLSNYL